MTKTTRELRCHCGSLIARIVDGKLEVKCRRCQRVGFIDLSTVGAAPDTIEIEWSAAPTKAKPR